MQNELNTLFLELHTNAAVNHHLGGVVEGLMDFGSPFDKRDERFKREFTEEFIRESKPKLNLAMDHLNRFAYVIGNLEMLYQRVLDHPELNLEEKIRLENASSCHVINLKRLHGKQKETLTAITQLFLELSKNHLRLERRRKR